MIRFLNTRKTSQALAYELCSPCRPRGIRILHYFCSEGPKKGQEQPSPKQSGKGLMKFSAGIKNAHPIYQLAKKQLRKHIRERSEWRKALKQKKIPFSFQITWLTKKKDEEKQKEKEKQNKREKQERKSDKIEGEKNPFFDRKIRILSIILILIYISKEDKNKQMSSSKKLQLSPLNHKYPVVVKAVLNYTGHIFYSINIQMEQGIVKKVVVNEDELVNFLTQIEQSKLGDLEIKFMAGNLQPFISKDVITIMAILMGIITVRLFLKALKAADYGNKIQIMPFKSEPYTPISSENIKVRFKDVAGMHEAKIEVTEFVDFLKNQKKYKNMGVRIPKGILLTGPPGTGKTLLAKACAGETEASFFSLSGSQFVHKYSGLGASRIRELFESAEKCAPSIIFIDEIDAIGKKRDGGPFSNEEKDNTLNQLLVKMDGFEKIDNVLIMAATNRKDMLDPALLRPGRFDRSVEISLPNFQERRQILKVHLKEIRFDKLFTIEELANKIAVITPGFSGAELANTCNEAAILAAREEMEKVLLRHFEKATERVMAGLEKRNIFTLQERESLAYYECGKVIASWYTEGSDPIIKISILPFSKSSTGFSHAINNEAGLFTQDELLAKVCCNLAGRASELHFKGYTTTNGDGDLKKAKKIITSIVKKFGMSESLKMMAYPDFDFIRKPYSEKVEAAIDDEIARISEECQHKVESLIKEREKEILALKEKLMEKETLTHTEIKELLGEREVESDNLNYEEYLKGQKELKAKEKLRPSAL